MPRKAVQRSTEHTPPKPVKTAPLPGPVLDGADLVARWKDFPAIDVLERRLLDPGDPGSQPILLKDEDPHCCVNSEHQNALRAGSTKCHVCKKPVRKWYVRYFNLAQAGRAGQMRAKGYLGVEIKELQTADDVADLYRSDKDGLVRRGDRGQEMLGKQPLEFYNEVKRRQRAIRDARMQSASARRHDLADAAGRALGDEAGTSIHGGMIKEEFMRREQTTLEEEAGE